MKAKGRKLSLGERLTGRLSVEKPSKAETCPTCGMKEHNELVYTIMEIAHSAGIYPSEAEELVKKLEKEKLVSIHWLMDKGQPVMYIEPTKEALAKFEQAKVDTGAMFG